MNIVDIEKLPVRRTKSLSTEKLQETEAEGRRPGIVWSRSNEEQTLDIEPLNLTNPYFVNGTGVL